jgi:phage terminase large subunit-like protein
MPARSAGGSERGPSDRHSASVPATAQDEDRFTAVVTEDGYAEHGTMEFGDDGVVRLRDVVQQWRMVESSDPRVSGDVTWSGHRDQHGAFDVSVGSFRVENADGAWQEAPTEWLWFDEGAQFVTSGFTGEGAYEGLTLVSMPRYTGVKVEMDGVIFEGEMPPVPGLPSE